MTGKVARALTASGADAAIAITGAVAPTFAEAKPRLSCKASVSNSHPTQNSVLVVSVRTKSKAAVKTTAHYKSTNTSHTAKANSKARASLNYRISRATTGFKVKISVAVKRKGKTGSCSISLTPR